MDRLEELLKGVNELYDSSIKSVLPPMVAAALELSRTYRANISGRFYVSSSEETRLLFEAQRMVEKVAFLAREQKMYAESSELYYNIGGIVPALETAEEGGLAERRQELCVEYLIFLSQHGDASDFAKEKFGEDKQTLLSLVEMIAKKVDSSAAYSFGINCGLEAQGVINLLGEDDFCASV